MDLVAGHTDASIAGSVFSYTHRSGAQLSDRLVPVLTHVLNHATWHRGQISAGMTRRGLPPPELDLLYFLQPGN